MSDGKKPGFFQRLFGIGGVRPKPAKHGPPAKKEPPADAPKRKPPGKGTAKKEPPEQKRSPKMVKAESKPSAKPEVPLPGGPHPAAGEVSPEERPPGDREKGAKERPEPSFVSGKIGPKRQAKPASKAAHPPAGPATKAGATPPEELLPAERKTEKPNG